MRRRLASESRKKKKVSFVVDGDHTNSTIKENISTSIIKNTRSKSKKKKKKETKSKLLTSVKKQQV